MAGDPVLRVCGLFKAYPVRQWWGPARAAAPVLRGVSLTLDRARTLAIVGPSGSGKTTLARCIAGIEPPDAGEVHIAGPVQLIPQQPAASLNPRFTAGDIVAEPLVIRNWGDPAARRDRALDAMASVGLDPAAAGRRALAFSGGERQRLAIARALVVEPALLVLDESLAGLDLSLQAQVANLLLELQERRGMGYVIISHDLTAVARIADEIAVMYGGAIVERGPAAEVLAAPCHAVTRDLAAAAALVGQAP